VTVWPAESVGKRRERKESVVKEKRDKIRWFK